MSIARHSAGLLRHETAERRRPMSIETSLVHPPSFDLSGSVSTPIHQTATFRTGDGASYDYSRSGNPTRDVLETQLSRLEGGATALAYGSGVTAIDAVFSLLNPDDRLVIGDDLYGGTARLAGVARDRLGVDVVRVDPDDASALDRALVGARMILVESLTNPRLRRPDITAIASRARAHGAWLAVDNTMLTPLLCQPLGMGADIAIQSATKLLAGHSDLTAGLVATNDPDLAARLAFDRNARGTALAPFESWLLLRGLETLAVRLHRQLLSTGAVLRWLRGHPSVCEVLYPDPDPDGEAQGSCVISFRPCGGAGRAEQLLKSIQLFHCAVSFGGVASSISQPRSMSHASIPAADRSVHEIPEDLLRLSIGLENPEDLIADLSRVLEIRPASAS